MSLDPSTEEGRRLLEGELAKAKYAPSQPGLLERFQDWLFDLFEGVGSGVGAPAWLVPVVILVVLAGIGLILWRVLRREPAPTGPERSGAVLEGITQTATELRASAAAALARGDASSALLDSFRALVVSAIERTILDDQPGRTAHEAARDLASAFPDAAPELARIADLFDGVRYGGLDVGADQARSAGALDARLVSTRPVLTDVLAGSW